ncbi:MAG: hypothetical protein EXR82_07650 [Gammaproteobacteria bacterium]|nr:hypothetical protein [Gammaproteobacteria bacterium]
MIQEWHGSVAPAPRRPPAAARQDFSDSDRCHREAHLSGSVRLEEWPETFCELWVTIEEIDNRRRIHQEQRVLWQIGKV